MCARCYVKPEVRCVTSVKALDTQSQPSIHCLAVFVCVRCCLWSTDVWWVIWVKALDTQSQPSTHCLVVFVCALLSMKHRRLVCHLSQSTRHSVPTKHSLPYGVCVCVCLCVCVCVCVCVLLPVKHRSLVGLLSQSTRHSVHNQALVFVHCCLWNMGL